MKVGYAVLYEDGTLVISANHIKQFKKFSILSLRKNIYKDYGKFDDDNVPWKREYNKTIFSSVINPSLIYLRNSFPKSFNLLVYGWWKR